MLNVWHIAQIPPQMWLHIKCQTDSGKFMAVTTLDWFQATVDFHQINTNPALFFWIDI